MAETKVPVEYQNPSAVYRFPINQRSVTVSYKGAACQLVSNQNPGFKCADTFIKLHGYNKSFLLVPSGRSAGPLLFSALDAKGIRVALSAPKQEMLMSPITSDFVDVHNGDSDCR